MGGELFDMVIERKHFTEVRHVADTAAGGGQRQQIASSPRCRRWRLCAIARSMPHLPVHSPTCTALAAGPQADAAAITAAVLSVMEHCHKKGIIHRGARTLEGADGEVDLALMGRSFWCMTGAAAAAAQEAVRTSVAVPGVTNLNSPLLLPPLQT